jgi:hypothetical protein
MRGHSWAYWAARIVVALLCAAALVVKGLQEPHGRGWPMFLVAVALLVALALRYFAYRD